MKLSKKGEACQRAIHKALAAGKALGGLLAGVAMSMVGGCSEHSPADTMGSYPAPNSANEGRKRSASVMGKMLLTPPRQSKTCTNAVNETNGVVVTTGEEMPPPKPPPKPARTNAVNEAKGVVVTKGMPINAGARSGKTSKP